MTADDTTPSEEHESIDYQAYTQDLLATLVDERRQEIEDATQEIVNTLRSGEDLEASQVKDLRIAVNGLEHVTEVYVAGVADGTSTSSVDRKYHPVE